MAVHGQQAVSLASRLAHGLGRVLLQPGRPLLGLGHHLAGLGLRLLDDLGRTGLGARLQDAGGRAGLLEHARRLRAQQLVGRDRLVPGRVQLSLQARHRLLGLVRPARLVGQVGAKLVDERPHLQPVEAAHDDREGRRVRAPAWHRHRIRFQHAHQILLTNDAPLEGKALAPLDRGRTGAHRRLASYSDSAKL